MEEFEPRLRPAHREPVSGGLALPKTITSPSAVLSDLLPANRLSNVSVAFYVA